MLPSWSDSWDTDCEQLIVSSFWFPEGISGDWKLETGNPKLTPAYRLY